MYICSNEKFCYKSLKALNCSRHGISRFSVSYLFSQEKMKHNLCKSWGIQGLCHCFVFNNLASVLRPPPPELLKRRILRVFLCVWADRVQNTLWKCLGRMPKTPSAEISVRFSEHMLCDAAWIQLRANEPLTAAWTDLYWMISSRRPGAHYDQRSSQHDRDR